MPELPEVETTKASLAPLLGQRVHNVSIYQPKLRWSMPDNLSDLIGHQFTAVTRRAKYLQLYFAHPKQTLSLLLHLGMSGSLQQHPNGYDKRKHDHLIVTFADADKHTQLHFHDPRRFGAVLWHHHHADRLLNHLGVEPLDADFNGDYLYQYIHQRAGRQSLTRPIKSLLMDQAVVVGVGNIYASESLFLAGIHPAQPAHTLTLDQLAMLAEQSKAVLAQAITQGGSTLRDFSVGSGQTGYFQQTLYVYGRQKQPCRVCATPLELIKIAGRASVFCATCQPLR